MQHLRNNPWVWMFAVMVFFSGCGTRRESLSAAENIIVYALPDPASEIVECQTATFSVADCINQMSALKSASPTERWTLRIAPGTYSLKEAIVLFDVTRLRIEGAGATETTLIANGLPANRTTLQYFSVVVLDSSDVSLAGFKLSGNGLSGTRGIGACALPTSDIQGLAVEGMLFKDYRGYNFIAGNSLLPEHFTAIISDYGSTTAPGKQPLKALARYLSQLPPESLYCGGGIRNVSFARNTIQMRSVGFYFVPPTTLLTRSVAMPSPNTQGNAVPTWYSQSRELAARYSNIVVDHNTFVNDLTSATEATANDYHSAIKVGVSLGMRILSNQIDVRTLPQAFQSGAAINIAADCHDAEIDANTISLPVGNNTPNGIGVQSYYQTHTYYGFGDKKIFGAVSGLRITGNAFNDAKIRFADCCVQTSRSDFDGRPYCVERDALLQRGRMRENHYIGRNSKNGLANQDRNLVVKASADTAWVQFYRNLEATGDGGIYCRQNLDITYP